MKKLIFDIHFYFLFLPLFLFSCSVVKKTSIDVLMPSEFSFPGSIEKTLVLNNSHYFSVDSSVSELMNTLTPKEEFIIDTIATIKLFDGFFSVTDDSPNSFLRNVGYREVRNTSTKQVPDPLSEVVIIDLCTDSGVDALISLEYYDMDIDYSSNNINPYEFEAIISIYFRLLWRIYYKTGLLLNDYLYSDTLSWSSLGYSAQEAYNALPYATDVIRSSFFTAGQNYARRISSHWLTVQRLYYQIRGRDGKDYSFDRDYLIKVTDSNNKKKAYKALFNLALISEKNDDLRSAIRWLELAEFKNPASPYTSKYKNVLEQRLLKGRDL